MKNTMLAAVCLLGSSLACAEVTIADPWVRATVPAQKATGAFMQMTSTTNVKLVAAQSPVANVVEIHEMKMDNNVMKMRQITGLDLAAGKMVELKPGSYHIMLLELKQQVREGDAVPVSLVFEDQNKQRQTVDVKAVGRPLNAAGGTPAAKSMH
ncbi:copper chaperone PCu(A)C [Herbaspirillum autotrophicum]|uniref:copper chaperone PCu(A)C n=1 Tax=Herbaspirillum autotrophicum TaxID=180195 RepID=UPI00067BAF55|nr:copper chaperone PCu(A)C [Herbaspirillum autotrophicum]